MRPWMGALAVAAAMAVMPSAALADDGRSVCSSSCRTRRTMEQLSRSGSDLDHGFSTLRAAGSWPAPSSPTTRRRSWRPWAIRRSKVLQTPADVDALRAAREATIDAGDGRQGRADERRGRQEQEGRRRHGPCPARGLLGGRLRALALGRGHDDAGAVTCTTSTAARCTYTGPALVAAWYDAAGTQIGTRQAVGATSTPTSRRSAVPVPRDALPPRRRRRRRHADAGLRADRRAQRRRRRSSTSRSGSATAAPRSPQRLPCRTSTRTTSTRRRATSGCAELAARVPEHREGL